MKWDWLNRIRILKIDEQIVDIAEWDEINLSISSYRKLCNQQEIELQEVNSEIVVLNDKIKKLVNPMTVLEKKLITKYPPVKIKYKGRSLPFSNTAILFPINCLLTPYDPDIISDLIDWGLYRTGEDYETLIPKIYKNIFRKYYKYEQDRVVWGSNEVFEIPFELRAKGFSQGYDCDSWANFQVSYYLASGLPYFVVRGVAGGTSLGGHATVYVYSQKTKKFHHLNSTYGGILKNNVSEYPTHKDAEEGKDKIGINKVWFSWDLKRCYYDFNQDFSKELEGFIIEEE